MTSPDIRVAFYLHQFDQLGEASVGAIARTLRGAGVTELRAKTHQATTWLGAFDRSPLAFHSLDDVRARRDQFAAAGIALRAWCVPTGAAPDDEADFAALIARELGGIELDIEPYPGFWDGDKAGLLPYLRALQVRGASFDLDFDARPGGYEPFPDFAAAARLARSVWTQSYWGTGGFSAWQPTLDGALAALDALGVPSEKRGIVFPWQGCGAYGAAAGYLRSRGVTNIGVWKMGEAGESVYAAVAALTEDSQKTVETIATTSEQAKADPDFAAYAPRTGTWREAAINLKGIADHALAAGRQIVELVGKAADEAKATWGGE